MLTIPEIATQIVNKTLSQPNENNSRTIFLAGSRSVGAPKSSNLTEVCSIRLIVEPPHFKTAVFVKQLAVLNTADYTIRLRHIHIVLDTDQGKSTLLYSFLDKNDTPRETLVLEYSFGRKSNQKQGIEKTICHVWEYGGKLDLLKSVFASVSEATRGKWYYCVMVDLSKIKTLWSILETCIRAITDETADGASAPEIIIIGGKYDLFKNYDSEIKKFICTTIRSVALFYNAHLLFYSSKEPQLVRRAKDMFHSIGFGNGVPLKEKNTNYTKPLVISKGSDSWESIGIQTPTIEQIKSRHISRIPMEPDITTSEAAAAIPQRSHPEPVLDSLATLKYEEIRNLQSLDIPLNDYLLELH